MSNLKSNNTVLRIFSISKAMITNFWLIQPLAKMKIKGDRYLIYKTEKRWAV
jgi:hypothetical protein